MKIIEVIDLEIKKEICQKFREKCKELGLPLIKIEREKGRSMFFYPVFRIDEDFKLQYQHDVYRASEDIMSFYSGHLIFGLDYYKIPADMELVDIIKNFKSLKKTVMCQIIGLDIINSMEKTAKGLKDSTNIFKIKEKSIFNGLNRFIALYKNVIKVNKKEYEKEYEKYFKTKKQ